MALRFTVLGSGSAGNACLVEANGFGLLLDVGLGPRQLASRLAGVGAGWQDIHAVILTHTHSDHWRERTFAHLHRRGIPLYCHPEHHAALELYAPSFTTLLAAGLVRPYAAEQEFVLAPGMSCRPLALRHDSGATFGFRLEGTPELFGPACSLAYAADLGCWDEQLARALADVDLLALEFNHDVAMEHASGRHPRLIARVLGDEGHLSNEQAAALVRAVLRHSAPSRLRHLVQLHLSRQCNHPTLAVAAARQTLSEAGIVPDLHTAAQDRPGTTIHLGAAANGASRRPRSPRAGSGRRAGTGNASQAWLPGMEG